jgi:transcriptional antiterminator RfaH
MQDWYLIRTKTGAERTAYAQLQHAVDRILLPLANMQVRQRDRSFQRVSPVFPCYLFAHFDLARMARQIRYTPGVSHIVRFGEQAAVVPTCVIDELIARCGEGPVDLLQPTFSPGTPVKVVHGPFQEFRAVFDGYLSGTERVAVLLKVMNEERRVVMPARMVIAAE